MSKANAVPARAMLFPWLDRVCGQRKPDWVVVRSDSINRRIRKKRIDESRLRFQYSSRGNSMASLTRDQLLSVALDAALEIETLLTGRTGSRAKIFDFLSAIDGYRSTDETPAIFKLASDPSLFPAVTRAATATGGHLTTVQQIQDWLRELVDSARSAADNAQYAKDTLKRLQDFCLQLRNEVLADISSEHASRGRRPAPYVYQVDPPLL